LNLPAYEPAIFMVGFNFRQNPGEKVAMKAGSLFIAGLAVATLSIAPASAQKNIKVADNYKCSSTSWPVMSPFQCNKPVATSYVECVRMVTDKGWRASDAWYGCSNQAFKN
jgi:hypothetical protein